VPLNPKQTNKQILHYVHVKPCGFPAAEDVMKLNRHSGH